MSNFIDNRLGYHGASKVPLHSVQAQAAAMNVDGHVVTDAKVWTAALAQFPLNSTTAMKKTTDIVGATNDLISVFTNNRTESEKVTKTALHNGFVWRNTDYPAVELYDAVEMTAIPGSNGAESPNGEFQAYEILDAKGLRVTDWVPVTAVIDPETGSPTPGYSGIAEAVSGSEWTVLQDSAKGDYGWALAKGNWEFVTMAGMLRFEPNFTPEGLGYTGVRYTGFKYIGDVLTDTLEDVKTSVETNIQPKLTVLEGKITDEEAARKAADSDLQGQIDTINETLDTLGSVDGGSIADALATKVSQSVYDAKVAELEAADAALQSAVDSKVTAEAGKELIPTETLTRLSEYPEYQDVVDAIENMQDAEEVTAAIQAALTAYYTATQVDAKIGEAAARVFKYIGTVETVDALPAAGTEGLAIGHVYHVNADKGEYAWNGEVWEPLGGVIDLSAYATIKYVDGKVLAEENRAKGEEARIEGLVSSEASRAAAKEGELAGAIAKEVTDREAAVAGVNAGNISLLGYAAEEGDVVTLEETDSVNDAFDKVVGHLNTLNSASGDNASGLTELAERVGTAEGEIDTLQAATAGFDGESTIAAAIEAAQGAAESTAAADATSKADAAQAAAKTYTDEEIVKAKTDIESAYGSADTALGKRIDDLNAVVSGNKTDIEGQLATTKAELEQKDSALESAIAANTSAIEGVNTGLAADIEAEEQARTAADNELAGRATALEAATAGFSGDATVASGIATAKAEAISEAGTAADGKVAAAKTEITEAYEAADTALDGKISANTTAITEEASAREAADTQLAADIAAKADPVKVAVVGAADGAEVSMVAGTWYIIKDQVTCTLPADAAEGTFIKVSVAVGGDNRRVVAPEGESINGASYPCAVGITEDGIAIDTESYYFVKISTDWVIL